MSVRWFLLWLLPVPLFLLFSGAALAQGSLPSLGVGSYVGQNVSSVEVAGRPDMTTDSVQNLIAVAPDKPLNKQDVDQTVNALKRHPGINDVTVDLQPSSEGVQVRFVLGPAMYVGMYQFPGALGQFAYTRLLQVSNYNVPAPYAASDVRAAEDALVQFFRQQGFFRAEVSSKLDEDREHNLVNVNFRTVLGKRAKLGRISLEGTTPEESSYLKKKLRSVMARLRGSSLKTGATYSYWRLKNATTYLQGQLAKQDYIAGDVKLVSAEYDANTNRADVTFHVETGEKIKIKTEGAKVNGLLHPHTLRDAVPIYAEQTVNEELIREGQQNILSYFQKKGFFDARVNVKESKTPAGRLIVYEIHKENRFKVDEVLINGNHHFSDKELAPHLSVKKGKFFSRGAYSDKLVRASAKNLTGTYQAAGYSQVQVVPKVARAGGDIDITFQINEGPLTRVENLAIKGNDTMPESQLAPNGLNLAPGKPYSQELVAKDRSLIMAHYLTQGYLNASFRASAKPVPGDAHKMNVTYQISEGPKVVTATIITDGKQHTRQEIINRQIKLASNQPLSENELLSSESELYNLEIFDWAEVDPKRSILNQTSEDVVVKVHERKRNSIVYGFGFQVLNRGGSVPSGTVAVPGLPVIGLPNSFKTSEKTFWGPDATFEYTRHNMRGRAETLNFSAFGGRLDQRAALTYTDPYFKGTNWTASTILSGEHSEENPIFTDRLGSFGFQLKRPAGKSPLTRKANNLFLRYNFQLTRISNLLIPDLVPANQLNVHLSTVSASFVHDTRDNVLDAHRGFYTNYEIDVSPKFLGSNFSFAQLLTQTAYYKQIKSTGIIWASSLRIGLEQPIGNSEVPLSSRYFAGGGSTLRGFPLNGAGPQRTIPACGNPNDPATCTKITVPEGGNELFIINTELRFPLNSIKQGLGIVTFYDGGNVFPIIGFHDFTKLYSNNVGIGFRYATPVGPIRIDIGHNLNPIPGIKSTQYFITLGQAF